MTFSGKDLQILNFYRLSRMKMLISYLLINLLNIFMEKINSITYKITFMKSLKRIFLCPFHYPTKSMLNYPFQDSYKVIFIMKGGENIQKSLNYDIKVLFLLMNICIYLLNLPHLLTLSDQIRC